MNDFSQHSDIGLGLVRVDTTSNGGHPVEFWVDRTLDRLVYVSNTAPPAIRDQAMAYQEKMRQVIASGMSQAVQSHHTTLLHHLNKAGMREAAALIQTIRS